MKSNIILITFLAALLAGCGKDEPKECFRTPALDWTFSKLDVKAAETRTLLADRGPDYAVIIAPGFESRGDGSLEYAGENDKVTGVTYAFYCNAGTLVAAYVDFVSNEVILEDVKQTLHRRYGDLYTLDNSGPSPRRVWREGGAVITLNLNPASVWVSFVKDPL